MKLNYTAAAVSIALLFAGVSYAGAITLDLVPANGAVSGRPGQTTGWGFTLTNTGPDFLLVTGTSFVVTPLSSFGTYTDLLSPQITGGATFLVLGPSPETPSLQEAFDAGKGTGIGEFTFARTAAGQVAGNIVVDYALFSVSPNDPNFDPGADLVTADANVSAAATITVSPASAVPEPGTLLFIAGGMVCLLARRRFFRHM
jgi:hypothetical protein